MSRWPSSDGTQRSGPAAESGAVTLTVTRMTTAGPPAAQVTDALAGRGPTAALGGLPASSRAALSHLAEFFNTPAEQQTA